MPRPRKHFEGEDFRLDTAMFRSAIQAAGTEPPSAPVDVWLDSSWTANEKSDRSAFVAVSRTIREDGMGDDIHIRDGATQRWRGAALVDAAIDFCVKHKPETFHIEGIPGTDMFCDFFLLKCGLVGIEPPHLDAFKPHQMKGAKNHRIRMLPTLFEVNPPALKLYHGSYLWALMEEAENFIPSAQNSGRQVGLLDVLALAIFGGM